MNKGKKYQILLVEDNPDDVFLMQYTFQKLDVNVDIKIVNNGKSALDYLNLSVKNKSVLPDLIILDINLPRLNGLEVLRSIKSNPDTMAISTIIFTSSNLSNDMDYSYGNGADLYLLKPNNIEELKETMKYVVDGYLYRINVPALVK